MIPEGWKYAELQEVAPVIDCKHKTPNYSVQGIPIVSPGNLAWGPLKLEGCRTISEADHADMMDHCTVALGDVVFGRNQLVGISSIVTGNRPFALGQDTVLIQPRAVDPSFLHQWLQSKQFSLSILRLQGGSTFGRINLKDLRSLLVMVPQTREAQRIAEILSTWDRAIEKVEELIANAAAQKKALMQSLLTGKHRLPGFVEEWIETPIAKMGTIVAGGTPDSTDPNCWGGDIAWATPTDITKLRTRHISQTERRITHFGLSSSAAKRLPSGAIIICTRATVGALAIATVPMTTNQGFKSIIPNGKHDSDFIYFLMSQNKKELVRAAGGSTFAEVSKADFEKLTFRVPPLDEQQAIAAVLICADTASEKLECKLVALRQEKSALMQQLLTGKRRVKVDLEAETC